MTLEIRQMVFRTELGGGQGAAASAQGEDGASGADEDAGANCCAEDEAASTRHREQRNQLRMLRAQLAMMRER